MSNANVKRIEILHEINSAITDYSQTLNSELRIIRNEINRTLDWLSERDRYWRIEVEHNIQNLNTAKRAYANCVSMLARNRGNRSSCANEFESVRAAEKALKIAQKELENVVVWRRNVDQRISAYMGQVTKIQKITNSTFNQASMFLKNKARDLGDFESIHPPNNVNIIGQRGSLYEKAKQEMLEHALDDPLISRDIKGWIKNEIRRIRLGQSERIRMPGICRMTPRIPDLAAGHRIHDVHHWSNLRFEDVWLNNTRYHRARNLGISDRYR